MKSLYRFSFRVFADMIYKASRLDVFGKYKWLKTTIAWDQNIREEFRLQRLNFILKYAWDNVSFYREFWGDHGVEYNPLKSIEELQKYPIVRKDFFKQNSRRFQSESINSIRHRKASTGGTTGRPVQYTRDLEQWTLMEAFHLWNWYQIGYNFGDPVGVIAGGSLIPERNSFESRLRSFLHRRLFLYGVAMNRSLAIEYRDILLKHKAKYLYGYPSVLYLFGKQLAEQGTSLPGIRAVVTTAEMLLPQYRSGIEEFFGCKVFNNLGGNDGGYESYECSKHYGFHYNDLQSVLEVENSEIYKEGNLLITNLWNRSTPFIRYENGDVVSLSDTPCSCGSPFKVISSVIGRTADILTFSNGQSLAGPALTLIFSQMDIDGWQVVQTGSSSLEVRISCSSEIKNEYIIHINKILRRYLSNEIEIAIKRVNHLITTSGGKLKPIWVENNSD